jgi:hypothetical protein
MPRIDIRNLTEEEKNKVQDQAAKLGLDVSGYIRLVINLDAATGIIEKLRKSE